MNIRRNVLTTAALLASASMIPMTAPMAFAQESEASEGQTRDVITVTARRREESLQETPVAVSVFSGEQLEELGAIDITALNQTTPNITLENSRATNNTLTAFIRGVGQQDPVAGFEQGVGIYLDDVYLNRPQAAILDIYDVERIEILRGPQGTLYGRNTIGGAVKYVTRGLADEPELTARISVGSYDQRDAIITASTPVTDSVRVGGSLARLTRGGFGENLTTGEDNYDKDVIAARASAEIDFSDTFQVRISADYMDDDSNPRHGYRLNPSIFTTSASPLPDRFDTEGGVAQFAPFNTSETIASGINVYADWQVTDRLTLRSVTAYRTDETDSLIDFDSTAAANFDAWVVYDNDQFSQEFQANYEGDRWNLVAGYYFLDANAFNAFDVAIFGASTAFTLGDVDTETWAVFGEATFDLTERLALTVGGRYTEDQRDTRVQRETFLGLGSPFFGIPNPSITVPVIEGGQEFVPTFTASRTDDAFTPRVILAYDVSDTLNIYASYSQGFKGGLFDPRGAYGVPEIRDGVAPEFVDSYEFGLKGDFFDGRLRANTAFFFADYTDVQIPGSEIITLPGGGTTFQGTLTNAGAAEIKGFEIEATAFLTDSLTANFALGYADAEYTEFEFQGVNLVTTPDARGVPDVQNTPDWTGNFSLNHTSEVAIFGHAGALSLIGSAAYRGDTQQFEFANAGLDQEAYWLLDTSAVWNADNGRVSVALHGRNLADEEYITSGYNFAVIDASDTVFFGNPRTFTATVTLRY
jgi:iron complex outermembrane receptor protein